jgi:magnesium transporter
MLTRYPRNFAAPPAGASWIDLFDPTEEEKSEFERTFGLRVPTREELSEIETTSRIRTERNALYMSAPLISIAEDGTWSPAPAGFVLSPQVLLTVHFAKLPAFEAAAEELSAAEKIEPARAFTRIIEEIVDRAADRLEASAERLDKASNVIFHEEQPGASRLSRDANLRRAMTQIGLASERISYVRYMLACLDRMAKFAAEREREWFAAEGLERLQAVRTDIASLIHFDESLLSRVQILQDAATAIISIGQNEVMKVLTVASVAGVPPVLVAGIYGMNFKYMPELNWPWGYAFALAVIVISTVLPLLWFRMKDWI